MGPVQLPVRGVAADVGPHVRCAPVLSWSFDPNPPLAVATKPRIDTAAEVLAGPEPHPYARAADVGAAAGAPLLSSTVPLTPSSSRTEGTQAGAAQGAISAEWSCSACTYLNLASDGSCAVCLTPK